MQEWIYIHQFQVLSGGFQVVLAGSGCVKGVYTFGSCPMKVVWIIWNTKNILIKLPITVSYFLHFKFWFVDNTYFSKPSVGKSVSIFRRGLYRDHFPKFGLYMVSILSFWSLFWIFLSQSAYILQKVIKRRVACSIIDKFWAV